MRLLVAYDGTDFHGLAPNEGVRTVVGELQRVIEPLIGEVPDIIMSGRTDKGVHAWGQVLSFTMPVGAATPERIQKSANSRLGPEIVARDVSLVPEGFSARFSATGRRYRYLIINREVNDPFLARTGWWVPKPLDVAAMRAACAHLIGEHDFTSFCRKPRSAITVDGEPTEPTLVRRVDSAVWLDLGDGRLRFDIAGPAFCHQMVRSIVGFMVGVGTGRRRADELPAVLDARDRSQAENPAPPHGLTLWQVDY
ncbi:MAG: tRNA pseudouridine(38-40) synthase TruA [Acidimicrobiia bacterium]|nr:tRNA pseudouridine(38-40) synthase TruA [Acidimicrobiia bacterium]